MELSKSMSLANSDFQPFVEVNGQFDLRSSCPHFTEMRRTRVRAFRARALAALIFKLFRRAPRFRAKNLESSFASLSPFPVHRLEPPETTCY